MAYATQLTIGTGNKVSLNYQSQDVNVSLTYELERGDTDLLAVVQEKAAEVAAVHRMAWKHIRDAKVKGETIAPTTLCASVGAEPSGSTVATASSAEESSDEEERATAGQQTALLALLAHLEWSEEQVAGQMAARFNCSDVEHLTQRQVATWLLELQRNEREKAQQRRQSAAQLNGKT